MSDVSRTQGAGDGRGLGSIDVRAFFPAAAIIIVFVIFAGLPLRADMPAGVRRQRT